MRYIPYAGVPPPLLRALRNVIRADSDPARQTLFVTLARSKPLVRLVYGIHAGIRGTWASAVLVSTYGVVSFLGIAPARKQRARVLGMAKHANARRQVARVGEWIGPDDFGTIRQGPRAMWGWSVLDGLVGLLTSGHLLRILRVVRRIDQRHGFLVSSRVSAAIAWYARSRRLLSVHRPDAILVSSDSNPEEAGFTGAARRLSIPTVFVSHAYPTPSLPSLDFSLSLLEGQAAVDARRKQGPIVGRVLLVGVEGEWAPMRPERVAMTRPVIGVFTPKALSWSTLGAIIDDCRRHLGARQVVIRWHPSMLETPRLARAGVDVTGVVESPRQALLADVARQCDWVVADDNSNVHLQVLKLGMPTVAVKSLGLYPPSRADQYGFVANGIVFPPVASLREMDVPRVIAFYGDGWPARFTAYDASYQRPPHDIGNDVRLAIRGLGEPPAPSASAT